MCLHRTGGALSLILILHQQSGDKDTKKKIRQKPSNEEEYELSRYKPVLRTVLEV